MNKTILIIFIIFLQYFIISCDKLNSPNYYVGIPSKIQISEVTYDENNNYYIVLNWDDYEYQFDGYRLTKDSQLVDNLSKHINSFTDVVKKGTYVYKLYVIKGKEKSLPSKIRIRINTKTYDYWYD